MSKRVIPSIYISISSDISSQIFGRTCRIDGRISFPHGVSSAVTLDGRQILYRNGNKSSEINKFPPRQLLASDTTDIVTNLTNDLSQLKREFEDLDRIVIEMKGNERNYQAKRKTVETQVCILQPHSLYRSHIVNRIRSTILEMKLTN